MPLLFLFLTIVGLSQSVLALECNLCFSTVSWDDCFRSSILQNCSQTYPLQSTHYCYILEEMDTNLSLKLFKQGCTSEWSFCSEVNPKATRHCSLCSDDSMSSECASVIQRTTKTADGKMIEMLDRTHLQQTESDAVAPEASQTNASTVLTMSSEKNEPLVSTSFSATIREKHSQGKDESRIWLHDVVENTLETTKPNPNRNQTGQSSNSEEENLQNEGNFTASVKPEAADTSANPADSSANPSDTSTNPANASTNPVDTSANLSDTSTNPADTTTTATTEKYGPIVATGPPKVKPNAASGLTVSASGWFMGLTVMFNFAIFRI